MDFRFFKVFLLRLRHDILVLLEVREGNEEQDNKMRRTVHIAEWIFSKRFQMLVLTRKQQFPTLELPFGEEPNISIFEVLALRRKHIFPNLIFGFWGEQLFPTIAWETRKQCALTRKQRLWARKQHLWTRKQRLWTRKLSCGPENNTSGLEDSTCGLENVRWKRRLCEVETAPVVSKTTPVGSGGVGDSCVGRRTGLREVVCFSQI